MEEKEEKKKLNLFVNKNDNEILDIYNIKSNMKNTSNMNNKNAIDIMNENNTSNMNNKNVIDVMNENKDMENKLCTNNDIYITNNFKINYTDIEIDNIMNRNQQEQCKLLTKFEKKQLKTEKRKNAKLKKKDITAEKREKAALISNERLLSDEDFKKIDTALAKQQITYTSLKRLHSSEREHGDFVKLIDIENIYKKRKHDKQTRIESVKVSFKISKKKNRKISSGISIFYSIIQNSESHFGTDNV